MGIGAYRHLVSVQSTSGAPLVPSQWFCTLQPAAASVIDGQAAFFVRGRFHPGINLETQIVHEGRLLQVQGVTDVDERHVELSLMAVEVRGRV